MRFLSDNPKMDRPTTRGEASSIIYRHGDHAGNAGDVWKHAILSSVVHHVSAGRGQGVFRYFESHCGGPGHVLPPGGEWRDGIGRLLADSGIGGLGSRRYFDQFAAGLEAGSVYPGSWMQVARHLDRRGVPYELKLCDTSSEVAAELEPMDLDFVRGDGFAELEGDLERDVARHTLVLIDPPYGDDHSADWRRVAALAGQLSRAGRCFAVWYPLYSRHTARRLETLVAATGSLAAEILWDELEEEPGARFSGCGMFLGHEAEDVLIGGRAWGLLADRLGGRFELRGR